MVEPGRYGGFGGEMVVVGKEFLVVFMVYIVRVVVIVVVV